MDSGIGLVAILGGVLIYLPLALLIYWGLSALMDRLAKKDHSND